MGSGIGPARGAAADPLRLLRHRPQLALLGLLRGGLGDLLPLRPGAPRGRALRRRHSVPSAGLRLLPRRAADAGRSGRGERGGAASRDQDHPGGRRRRRLGGAPLSRYRGRPRPDGGDRRRPHCGLPLRPLRARDRAGRRRPLPTPAARRDHAGCAPAGGGARARPDPPPRPRLGRDGAHPRGGDPAGRAHCQLRGFPFLEERYRRRARSEMANAPPLGRGRPSRRRGRPPLDGAQRPPPRRSRTPASPAASPNPCRASFR
jgi:hypothetical protein